MRGEHQDEEGIVAKEMLVYCDCIRMGGLFSIIALANFGVSHILVLEILATTLYALFQYITHNIMERLALTMSSHILYN
jgi:hypothetical protein